MQDPSNHLDVMTFLIIILILIKLRIKFVKRFLRNKSPPQLDKIAEIKTNCTLFIIFNFLIFLCFYIF